MTRDSFAQDFRRGGMSNLSPVREFHVALGADVEAAIDEAINRCPPGEWYRVIANGVPIEITGSSDINLTMQEYKKRLYE